MAAAVVAFSDELLPVALLRLLSYAAWSALVAHLAVELIALALLPPDICLLTLGHSLLLAPNIYIVCQPLPLLTFFASRNQNVWARAHYLSLPHFMQFVCIADATSDLYNQNVSTGSCLP